MSGSLLLLHSPLTGPSVWQRLRRLAEARDLAVAVPDLRDAVTGPAPRFEAYVEAATAAAADLSFPTVAVGHSGAGVYLPLVVGASDTTVSGAVFVDAVVPPAKGHHRTPERLLAFLEEQTEDGLLRPWLDWWPDELITSMLPNRADRDLLGRDLPRVPRALYDEDVPMPDGWGRTARYAYLQTSPAYDADHREARERGWATDRLEGTHLSLHTDAETVLSRILLLSDAWEPH